MKFLKNFLTAVSGATALFSLSSGVHARWYLLNLALRIVALPVLIVASLVLTNLATTLWLVAGWYILGLVATHVSSYRQYGSAVYGLQKNRAYNIFASYTGPFHAYDVFVQKYPVNRQNKNYFIH